MCATVGAISRYHFLVSLESASCNTAETELYHYTVMHNPYISTGNMHVTCLLEYIIVCVAY